MSNTYRKNPEGKTYKESLKKKFARYKCRCEYCLGRKDIADKIAKKELKTNLHLEYTEGGDYDIPEQEEIINKYNTQWKSIKQYQRIT